MTETGTMRVVPSGKIYRQMFEAQVQLNRSLTKVTKDSMTARAGRGATLPIVHLTKDDVEHGILGERQQTWADGFPNDPYVENPVVYKQYAEYVSTQMMESEGSIAGKEVRGLPDSVAPAKEGSNIIERIAASRKERHEAAVEEMQQELSVISSELEPRITETCSALMNRLEENDKEIAVLLARFEKDEDLLTFTLDGLHILWTEIQSHSLTRQDWITQLDADLKRAEDDRMEMIQSVFKDYAKTLEKIAYVLAPDLHRFMDKESQVINQTVLSNRRAYGDLYVRLMSADIEREKTQHALWCRRVEDWKMLKTELAIQRFKDFMHHEKVTSPAGVQKVLQFMTTEQELLNTKRTELIRQLSDLKPPSSTKTSVYHWNKGVQDMTTEIDTTNQLHLSSLHKEYENVCQSCLDEIEEIKNELVDTGVCAASRAKTVVEEFMIPLVGDRQRIYEQTLESMEKALEDHNKKSSEELKSLFKFAQGAAHVWDVHEIGLARQERALQEKLEQSRQVHDNQNQDKEAHLDIIMDRMRQDAAEKALKDSLTRALEMLEKIRLAYEVFHKEQTQIVKQYPNMVQQELRNYDEAVCRLFTVDRNNPAEVGEEAQEEDIDGESEGGPSATNNSALSGQSTPAHFDKAKWQSVKLVQDDARSDSDRASSTASSRKHVTFGGERSENLTEIYKEKEDSIQPEDKGEGADSKLTDDKGERTDVGTKDVVAVESGATDTDYAELEKYAELYSDLDELEEGDLEDIGDLKEKLEEYFSLGESDSKIRKKPPVRPKLTKDADKDLPAAVSEVLSTAKGTTFYVLTVAGEHGISAEKSKADQKPGSPAFMTEVKTPEEKPSYLRKIEIPEALLMEIKKKIRLNFLNHLEDWTEQAAERAASVVVAKCEEMNSELDLRLHLHKPRARRAEYDVHNVRAAELVMHSERVTRHCKGILQALTDVRNKFTNMTGEHNKLAAKFREDIEALEVVFINATKAAKLYGLKNQLNVELDKFMSVIRASLRQFRQHLDETLQMLRESNARFIKSFKVFSDGGNFCPEEIEEYRKRLDKMANKIDQSEGSIMSDLEGMESKRLEQATKVAIEFEDRFKSHMFDLIFMEKIARWLTNTQVKIKAEVADSNSQAQQLAQYINDLDRRVDACERPNLDKEQITAQQLNDSLKGIFEAFHARSSYLNCMKDPTLRPPSGTMQGAPAVGARVGFAQDMGPTPISKAGKMPSEDPSVGVIKNIMKTQKTKLRFGMDAELDGEYMPAPGTELRDKMKSSMSTNASSERGKMSRRGVSPGLASTDGNARKAQSAAASVSSKGEWIRRSSKPAKFERKVLIFGDVTSEEEDVGASHFLGIVRRVLREALDGLLSASEMYYRQKGSRPVTRPQALQETYEQCTEVISQKLQSYYQQADDYHNQCLQELRSQLTHLEKSTTHVPSLVTNDLVKEQLDISQNAMTQLESQYKNTQLELDKKRQEHKHLLRPNLGHPHQVNQLTSLCEAETERHNEYMEVVEKQSETLQNSAADHAKEYLESLARLSENQLLQYDNMLIVDDVIKGRIAPTKYPTSELIRRKNAGEPLEDDEDKDALPRGKSTWQGLPSNEFVAGEKSNKQQLTASVTTATTTLAHNAVVKARDEAYQEYKKQFEKALEKIADEKQKLIIAEERWMESWNTSVEKVKQLY